MKKNLLAITAVAMLAVTSFAQNQRVKTQTLPSKFVSPEMPMVMDVENNTQSTSASNNLKANTTTALDTNVYWAAKNYYLTPSAFPYSTKFSMPNPSANFPVTHFGSIYQNGSMVKAKGAGVRIQRNPRSVSASVDVTVLLCRMITVGTGTNQTVEPQFPGEDSITVAITGTATATKYALFNNPQVMNENFALIVKPAITAQPEDSFFVWGFYSANPSTFTTTTWNYDEGALFGRFTGDANIYGVGNYEQNVRLIYETDLTSSFTSVNSGSCAPVTYTSAANSPDIFINPTFNWNAFKEAFNPTSTVQGTVGVVPAAKPVFEWNVGNGSPDRTGFNTIADYTAGSYTISLTSNFAGFSYFVMGGSPRQKAEVATEAITVDACTGLNTLSTSNFVVYPNPSNGVIAIKNLTNNSTVELVNILGEVIYKGKVSGDATTLDFSSLPTANYYLKVTNAEGQSTVKKLQFN